MIDFVFDSFFVLACLSLSGNRFISLLICSISFCISCCGLNIYTYQEKVFLYYTNFFIFLVFFVVVTFYFFIFYLFLFYFFLFNCRKIMCTCRRDRNTVYTLCIEESTKNAIWAKKLKEVRNIF